MAATDSLIEYPCDFPVKVMGLLQQGFTEAVTEVVMRHDQTFDITTIEVRPSSGARYVSLTCTVRAKSREQLDALYQELCDHSQVVMVL
ncbi:MAG: DUF493 domain-containing protein [Candidatus Nitrotoga sp.]|jgi:uncharacterized protein|nr:DUF493 domain-containing protein [Candidatus Nitrotoga sp.]MBP0117001.1 DUF493 domain-containing protein [Candidatus Nitrotoga sp.]MBP0123485.1 DUF493 domain-containing protein [Candidatus Nitrotoga sp.]MBP0126182.1 DUF493 domain-containing protein [Candidatus Nitrotoga sp.]MDW7535044.1 DUF493 domain-containing protein [Candidatus Nitrotoga sp.]